MGEEEQTMQWEEALDEALELGGDSAYHPLATVTFATGFYTVATVKGPVTGLGKEEVEELLTDIGANDGKWSSE